mmetsp:Transcript_17965/g.42445  ORF Transcript_17965/g.42445 Transcript_17965/m.42445 type:complete len:206 (-) Transcript_17965:1077-1694(-)
MAMKTASTLTALSSPVATSLITAPVTIFCWGVSKSSSTESSTPSPLMISPVIFSRVEFHRILMDGCSMTLCANTLEARNSSRLCTTVTDCDVRARTRASSMAASPPPTTRTSRPLKAAPSHVAHELTPPPRISYSPGTLSQLDSAPVATMMECVSIVEELVMTRKGRVVASILSTSSASKRVPNSTAWARMALTTPGPVELANPG